jgi:hypothetical protein
MREKEGLMGNHAFPMLKKKLKAWGTALILARGSEQRPGRHARGLLVNPG